MNFVTARYNQSLRDAIFEGNPDKARSELKGNMMGKADPNALSESGSFSMLHCAAMAGNTQVVMLLLQFGADVLALTDDGYSALDLAIWKGHLQVIELLRSRGCVAPMKEPESLNGKIIVHLGRQATVVDYEPSTSIREASLRKLHYMDGDCRLVSLWAGTDYKIVGFNPNYEELKHLNYTYLELPTLAAAASTTGAPSDSQSAVHLQSQHSTISAFRGRTPSTSSQVQQPFAGGVSAAPSASSVASPHAGAGAGGGAPQSMDDILKGKAFIDNDSDSDEDSEIDDIVEIVVPPGPLAVNLDRSTPQCALVVGFTVLPNGEKGPVETSGKVTPGMYIIGINEHNASIMSMDEVVQMLGRLGRKERTLRFAKYKQGSHQRPDSEASKSEKFSATVAAIQSPTPTPVAPPPAPTLTPPTPTPSPTPTPLAPVAPRKSSGSMSSSSSSAMSTSFASVASALMAKSGSSSFLDANPSECIHCHMPITHHTSDACPYK